MGVLQDLQQMIFELGPEGRLRLSGWQERDEMRGKHVFFLMEIEAALKGQRRFTLVSTYSSCFKVV